MRRHAIRLATVLTVMTSSLAFARGGGSSKAPPPAPADLVPYGADWSCFHPVEDQAAPGETPRCERTESACKLTRGTLTNPAHMTACTAQPSATVVTYFDPKRASWRFLASPDDDGCIVLRSGLISTKEYQRVSQCEDVGRRFPPPARLETAAITPGKSWFCLELPSPIPKGARPACMRSVAGCEEAIRRDAIPSTKCKERPHAYLLTFKDSSSVWGFAASTTVEACAAYRERVITAASNVSACAQVGEVVRPKLERSRVPKGRSWMCFVGADPTHPMGSCARTAKDCAAQYELDRYVLGTSQGCKTQSTAVVRNIQEQVFAFPNSSLCDAHVREHPDGSRCEAVN